MSTARDLYAAERARLRPRKRPADPQSARGGGDDFTSYSACAREGCGHSGLVHKIGQRDGKPARTGCTIGTAAGRCLCTGYVPGVADVLPGR